MILVGIAALALTLGSTSDTIPAETRQLHRRRAVRRHDHVGIQREVCVSRATRYRCRRACRSPQCRYV